MNGALALEKIGLAPLVLEAGEGLALINGTQVMTGIAALVVHDAVRLAKLADVACAMSLEVLMGSNSEFDPRIHQVRPHPGQIASARNMLRLTDNSQIILSHQGCARVQDAYTLRCSPQIHGASKDAVIHAGNVVEHRNQFDHHQPPDFYGHRRDPSGRQLPRSAHCHGSRLSVHGDCRTGKCFRKAHRAAGKPAAQRDCRLFW